MAARLPHPGGDNGNWGSILNDFLSQAHNTDGSLKPIPQLQVEGLGNSLDAKLNITDLDSNTAALIAGAGSATQTALSGAYETPTGAQAKADASLLAARQSLASSPSATNVVAHGATGDFTGRLASSGGTGTDNRGPIQAALDAASQRAGTYWYSYLNRKAVKVTLPPGHYLVSAPADGSPSLVVPEGVVFDCSQATLYFDYPAVATGSWCAIQLNNDASLHVGTIAPSKNNMPPDSNRLYDGVRSVTSDNFTTWIIGYNDSEIYGFQGASIRLIGSWITHVAGIRLTSDWGMLASQLPASNVYGITAPADMPMGANRGMTDLYITDCYFNGNRYGGFMGPIAGDGAGNTYGGDIEFTKGALQAYFTRCVWEYFNALPVYMTGYCASFVDCAWEEVGSNVALACWFQTVRSVYIQNFRLNWTGRDVPGAAGNGHSYPAGMFRCSGVSALTIDGGYSHNTGNGSLYLVQADPGFPAAWQIGRVYCDSNDFRKNVAYGGSGIESFSGTWNAGHLMVGGTHLWLDANGTLRQKTTAPASATDGTRIGALTGCKINRTNDTGLIFATAAFVAVPFDQEVWDTDGFHDPTTNNTRITIPVGLDGKYSFRGQITLAANATGRRILSVKKNGTATVFRAGIPALSSGDATVSAAFDDAAVAGDYYEMVIYQDSGTTLNTDISVGPIEFSCQRIGS